MVKRNYLKLILAVTIFFTTAIIAAISLNAAMPDIDFAGVEDFYWSDQYLEGSEDYSHYLAVSVDGFPYRIPGFADFLYDDGAGIDSILVYNKVEAIYPGDQESYLYWYFDVHTQQVDFYNWKMNKHKSVAFADLVDVTIADLEVPIQKNTVSFYKETDELYLEVDVMTFADLTLPADPEKTGYHFVGWYYDPLLHYEFDPDVDITHDFKLYAKWQLDDIEVNFYNGINLFRTIEIKYNKTVPLPNVPNSKDYEEIAYEYDFLTPDYYFDNDSQTHKNGSIIESIHPFNFQNITTMLLTSSNNRTSVSSSYKYGKYSLYTSFDKENWDYKHYYGGRDQTAKKTHRITMFGVSDFYLKFEIEGDYSSNESTFYKMILLVNPYLYESYEFENWYYDEELTIPYNSEDVFLEDTNLYAGYKEVDYDVNFYVNDNLYETINYNNINDFDILEDPIVENYNFNGWYYDEEFLNEFNIEDEITKDLNIYAKITPKEFNINYYVNEELAETVIHKATEDFILIDDPIPIDDNDVFLGWYLDDAFTQPFNPDEIITADLDLYALFDTTEFMISYYLAEELYAEKNYNTLYDLILPPTPTSELENEVFLGWYYDEEFTEQFKVTDLIEDDVTLYGKFGSSGSGGTETPPEETPGTEFKLEKKYVIIAAIVFVGIGLALIIRKRK